MSRIIRSCSLDRRTDDIAEGIPNFSKWVRSRLLAHAEERQARSYAAVTHVAPRIIMAGTNYEVEICWPFSKDGCCIICWPEGPPLEIEWREWSRSVKAGKESTLPKGQGWDFDNLALNNEWPSQRDSEPEKAEIEKKGRFKRLLIWLIQ